MKIFIQILISSYFLIPAALCAEASGNTPFEWTLDLKIKENKKKEATELEKQLFKESVTDGALIAKGSKIIYERYANGYSKDKKHFTWSVTKSFVNALFGIAVSERKLMIKDSVCKYHKFPTKNHCKITIDDLLRWSSGILWKEEYENSQTPKKSSVMAMLYGVGHNDMSSFVSKHKLEYEPPGSVWRYSSGTSNLLMGILKNALGADYDDFPWKKLFEKIGMKNVTWEKDSSGTFVGASYIYARPRDLLRFGLFYLKNGSWEGEQILPGWWVTYSKGIAPAFYKKTADRNDYNDIGGAHWWLNRPVFGKKIKKPWPDAPTDTFAARGHWGQFIFVIPSLNIVVVRTGNDRKNEFGINRFLKNVIAFAK